MSLSSVVTKLMGAVAVCAAISLSVFASTESLEDRIKPIGEICKAGDPCAAAAVATAASGPRTGEQVYSSACGTCHASGAAGAPKLGDAADWTGRLEERGLDTLYTHAIDGYNGMPAKGLCMDCSDDEIKVAVDYMVDNSK